VSGNPAVALATVNMCATGLRIALSCSFGRFV
jgi:hypothetical protein